MIDWDKQWASFAENFYDGCAHIPIGTKTLLLLPGPGFGDLSHPTTRLALELLLPRVTNQVVLDIGCGSGILTLAAAMAGAKHAYGIDIDPEAIKHAQKNARKNNLKATFSTKLPKIQNPIVVMNMIFSEQQEAMKQYPIQPSLLITSGILAEQKGSYLQWANSMGWQLIPGVIQESGAGKEAPQNACLEQATIASRKARAKTDILEESRCSQNRFSNHERYKECVKKAEWLGFVFNF